VSVGRGAATGSSQSLGSRCATTLIGRTWIGTMMGWRVNRIRAWKLLAALGGILLASGCATTAPSMPPTPIRVLEEPGRPLAEVYRQGRPLYVMRDNFYWCDRNNGHVIVVPSGFVTDFASIPMPARLVLPSDGPYAPAAILHDYMYAVGRPGYRLYADNVLGSAMVYYRVGDMKRRTVYEAVRNFGESGYGLPQDWLFYDVRTLRPRTAPAKPTSGVQEVLGPGCPGFAQWVRRRQFSLPQILATNDALYTPPAIVAIGG
jgi:hypothetical protein